MSIFVEYFIKSKECFCLQCYSFALREVISKCSLISGPVREARDEICGVTDRSDFLVPASVGL